MNLPDLPISRSLSDIKRALVNNSSVLTAPPGSGKTTLVPLALLDEPWLKGKKILILQPRRVATRAACFRMATILQEEPGKTVGYHIRQDRMVSHSTRIEVITEGILTKRIQNDPELSGVGLIIFDEYHERSIHADLALALCLDLCQINEQLKILVMSATLDTAPISHLLGGAPIIEATGKCYNVTVEYYSSPVAGRIANITTSGVIKVLTEQTGDILVFLPGVGDIKATEKNLKNCAECNNISIQALYGNLSQKEQDAILSPQKNCKRRVVLATSIAETSLTIDGITNVIDSGWSKRPFFNATNGLTSLQTTRVSKSAADQRAGRAGRLGPGYCLRLWDNKIHHSLPDFHPPEIINSDLSDLALQLLLWGVSDPSELLWLDPPRPSSYEKAIALLHALGATDTKKVLTPRGRQLALLPLHPRLGNLLIKSQQAGNVQQGADICALLTERDILDYRDEPSAEISLRLELLQSLRKTKFQQIFQDGNRTGLCQRVDQTSKLFKRSLTDIAKCDNPPSTDSLLISAYPDRIAKRLANQFGKYLLANGRVVRLNPSDPLNHSEYLVVANMDGGQKEGRVFLAEAVDLSTLIHDHPALITTQDSIYWDQEKGKVETILQQKIGAITLQEKPLQNVDEEQVIDTLIGVIQKIGLHLLNWTQQTIQLQDRVRTLREIQPEIPWPDLDATFLEKDLDWLRPYLNGTRNINQLKRLNLFEILQTQLDYKLQKSLLRDAPEHLQVPSGSRIKIIYGKSCQPILAVRVQELFGLLDTPSICGGRIQLVLHLLSPARRPIQVTSDLKGFWENSYHDVKKELKGRYPKHNWPDNPTCATATKTTKKTTRKS